MKDHFGRKIEYLRISITERCNLRCRYCMPEGSVCSGAETELTVDEILKVGAAAAALGIHSVKVTGGEPLVRKECGEIIQKLKGLPGIERVTLTTNGIFLPEQLGALRAAGVDGINISLDTVDRKNYRHLTGMDGIDRVMAGIRMAAQGPVPVKINCVSMKGDGDWQQVMLLAKELPVDVRFIEMMPLGAGKCFETEDHREVLEKIRAIYPGVQPDERIHGSGPAVYYRIPGFRGCIGFISAVHGPFCKNCNRVRLTADGFLKPCLCYDTAADLKPLLRQETEQGEKPLEKYMAEVIYHKPEAHCFETPEKVTESRKMAEIGGEPVKMIPERESFSYIRHKKKNSKVGKDGTIPYMVRFGDRICVFNDGFRCGDGIFIPGKNKRRPSENFSRFCFRNYDRSIGVVFNDSCD